MKQVPGRKTDVCDAEWICKLMSMRFVEAQLHSRS